MNSSIFQKCVGVASVVSCLTCSVVASHADPPAPAPAAATFASVDMQQVAQNSKAYATNKEAVNTFAKKLQVVFNKLEEGSAIFLSDAEITQLAAIYEKETPTEAEKKTMTDLEAQADQRKGTITRLESTASPTADQQKQYHDLQVMENQGKESLNKLGQGFQGRITDRENELTDSMFKQIRAAIADVAKQKAITVVFDSKVAVYATTDITTDVIKQVNK